MADTSYAASAASSVSTSKRTWKDAGSSAGTNLASLLRSAGRKSSESLRSLRSTSSRKSKKSTNHQLSSQASTGSSMAAPPIPSLSSTRQDKALPKSPEAAPEEQTREASMSSDVSRVIHDVPEEEQPFELYEMPADTPVREFADESMLNGRTTPTGQRETSTTPTPASTATAAASGSAGSAAAAAVPASVTNGITGEKSVAALNKESGSRLRELLGSSRVPPPSPSAEAASKQTDSGSIPKKSSLSKLKVSAPFGSTSSSVSRSPSVATPAALDAGTQWASEKSGGGDGNTIAQLYAVFGLPKDPAVWTLAEEDCIAGVHHTEGAVGRFWRPEVLGCSICPSPADVLSDKKLNTDKETGASKWSGRDADGKKPSNPKFIEMSDGRGGVEKAETARVLSKALKLSFTREIEIIVEQGNYPPSATSHTFSFSVPTVSTSGVGAGGKSFDGRMAAGAMGVSVGKANAASGVGEGYGLEPRAVMQGTAVGELDDGPSLATFYGVVLTVWSAADEKRAKTVKKELTRAAKQRGGANNATTSKTTKRNGSTPNEWASGQEGGKPGDEEELALSASLVNFPPNSTFFMPYAICIVSRYPLYKLLGDWNKMAWHKFSRNIEMHNQLMSTILRHPAPRLGERFVVGSPDKDLSFECTFPGALDWKTGLIGTDLTMWPLFKTLSLDNILTICEVALAPNGRVLFQSRHPALLGLAVESIRYLVELCGWRGVANQNCHARDVKIYLEDPGSWVIAINTELRSIIKPAKEVCMVDLDINFVNCALPPAGAVSVRQIREKKKRRLMEAIFVSNVECSPPREFVEAYPGGRFRPLSEMKTRDQNSAYEQLATPPWWNQTAVIQTFDKVLREKPKTTFMQKVLRSKSNKAHTISDSELAAILALRRRASTFVDARDGLENKIGRLNKRLAFLMSESDMWRAQFGKIQLLVDRLTKEANDLRGKVDKERRESRRLSSTLAQRDMEQVQLQLQLKQTESAREEAQAELLKMQKAMESLETEREAMMDEIRGVLSGVGGVEDVNLSLARLDLPLPSYNPLVRSDSPTGSQASMSTAQAADYIMKSRALAEAKISQGRPGREPSRSASSNGHIRSLSHDRGERQRRNPGMSTSGSTTSHGGNHFPDDQMNYEIQQRTSVVTSQISKIQAQLESTLTQLEGRRSGTYERENERRKMRRGSSSSLSSRYEYRAPSSLGHAGGMGAAASSVGHGSEDDRSEPYEYIQQENVKVAKDGNDSLRRRRENPYATSVSSSSVTASDTTGTLANTSLRSATPTSPLTSVASAQSINGRAAQPPLSAKSAARQQSTSGQWKEAAAGSGNAHPETNQEMTGRDDALTTAAAAAAAAAATQIKSPSSVAPPIKYDSEVMLASKDGSQDASADHTMVEHVVPGEEEANDSQTSSMDSSMNSSLLMPDGVHVHAKMSSSPLHSPIKETYAAYNASVS